MLHSQLNWQQPKLGPISYNSHISTLYHHHFGVIPRLQMVARETSDSAMMIDVDLENLQNLVT